ncbi:hypothetical protein FTO70_04345 [Methanosarcina sp. KYL-1]|uniref:hypothetical protein n=1 Tax=Methanosarcina sp. KYL-1 TaxID=2602068 RepID=UPI00210112ED|nr:hypothetical protein [Methanosarcina sp. KYL-1]MCQ1534931.1 hypothetical protein [Methanosarcina sp. KYL-1]
MAEEEGNVPRYPASDEEAFGMMKSRMTESIDSMIGNLEGSMEDLDDDLLEDAEGLKEGLESIKEDLEAAGTDSELMEIRDELNSLIEEAPEELKSILGPAGQMGQGSGSPGDRGEMPPQGFNGTENPEMMQNKSQVRDANMTMEDRKMPGQAPGGERGNGSQMNGSAEETGSENVGFFGRLINSIKSLFS